MGFRVRFRIGVRIGVKVSVRFSIKTPLWLWVRVRVRVWVRVGVGVKVRFMIRVGIMVRISINTPLRINIGVSVRAGVRVIACSGSARHRERSAQHGFPQQGSCLWTEQPLCVLAPRQLRPQRSHFLAFISYWVFQQENRKCLINIAVKSMPGSTQQSVHACPLGCRARFAEVGPVNIFLTFRKFGGVLIMLLPI